MPEPLTEDELERIVDDAIAETGATSMRDMGRVMADVMPQIAGRADGSAVSQIVRENSPSPSALSLGGGPEATKSCRRTSAPASTAPRPRPRRRPAGCRGARTRTATRDRWSPDPGGEDRAERRDPGRDPDLPERVVDPRRHARRARARDGRHGGRRERRVDEADADAREQEPGQQHRPVRAGVDPAHQQQRDGDERQPAAEQQRGSGRARSAARRSARRRTRSSVSGRNRRPAWSGESPRMFWR